MKKNLGKSLKVPRSFGAILLVLIGFGAGYTAKEYAPTQSRVPLGETQGKQISPVAGPVVSVCFTPSKQCQVQIITEINKAKKSIYVQAYSFTDQDIAQALIQAAQRGVTVKVLLDKSNRNDGRSAKDTMIHNGIPLRFDAPSGIAHNKVIILDQEKILTGSYNFSAAAYKRNTENLLILHDKYLAQQYLQNWAKRWDVSKEGEN